MGERQGSSGEVGFDLSPAGGVELSVTGFYRQTRDLIDWARPLEATSLEGQAPPPWETRNVEEANFKGLEAEFSGPGLLGTHWSVGGMWLSVDSREVSGFESKYALKPLEEQVTLALDRTFGADLSLGVNFRRAKRGGEGPYHRIDARGGFRIGATWLYLDATNLLDEDYADITGAPAPGRALFLGLEVGRGGGGRD
jgi:outer membrane cobalamin receptor